MFYSLVVFAEKVKKDLSEFNSIKWEKVKEKNSNNLKKIIWKSYNNDESYFEEEFLENKLEESFIPNKAYL